MNGTCYNCLRTEKEYQRFGRRRPPKPSRPPSHGRYLESKPFKAEPGREELLEKFAKRQALIRSEQHDNRRSAQRPKYKAKRSKRTGTGSERNKGRRSPGSHEKDNALRGSTVNRKRQRKEINRFLKDLYRSPRYLSNILQKEGLSRKQIDRLKERHLTVYLDSFVEKLMTFWQRALSAKKYEILRAHYALHGERLAKAEELARQFDASTAQIESYREQALTILRTEKQIAHFEKLVASSAGDVLGADKI